MRLRIHITADRGVAEVTLSRRNLLALLHKLEMPGSARTILSMDNEEPGWTLIVRSEDDEEHYGSRGFGPGPMHPMTELSIALASTDPRAEEEEPWRWPSPASPPPRALRDGMPPQELEP